MPVRRRVYLLTRRRSFLEATLALGKPLLFTSFSPEDARRDSEYLEGLAHDYEILIESEVTLSRAV